MSQASTVSVDERLPAPPSDSEQSIYIHRDVALLVTTSLISVGALFLTQVKFLRASHWLVLLAPVLLFTAVYYLISLRINITSRNFDYDEHRDLIKTWVPERFPSVDILLPICNESIAVLRNTWVHVSALVERYPGPVKVYVLDDGASDDASAAARSFGFEYHVRPNRGELKKAGNLKYGFNISSGEHLLILDADFAPRTDFLLQTLPYFDAYPDLGIVQTPQFFRTLPVQTFMERGAGAVQELFYRVVQVSRDRQRAAICVGSCAVYRRAALDAIGGTTQIEHSEDVHTGFDLGAAGWALKYLPIPMATGLCPGDPDSFLTQQYRWCAGSMSLLSSSKFRARSMPLTSRMCYVSGFCYYLHTALFTVVAPLIPLVLLIGLPGQVRIANYLLILPSTIYNLVVFPLWHRCRYGPSALVARYLYGWAHLFAIWDIVRRRPIGWVPTGSGGARTKTARMWRALTIWGTFTSAAWVGTSLYRMVTYSSVNFVFLLLTGLLYSTIVGLALWSRRSESA